MQMNVYIVRHYNEVQKKSHLLFKTRQKVNEKIELRFK